MATGAGHAGAVIIGSSVTAGQGLGQINAPGQGIGQVNASGQGLGHVNASGQGLAQINAFPDEKKIRELAEQIRTRLNHAHHLKLTASQQQQATPAAAMQVLNTG